MRGTFSQLNEIEIERKSWLLPLENFRGLRLSRRTVLFSRFVHRSKINMANPSSLPFFLFPKPKFQTNTSDKQPPESTHYPSHTPPPINSAIRLSAHSWII